MYNSVHNPLIVALWFPSDQRLRQSAPFLFGPKEGTRFFEPSGWREKEFHSSFQESIRLKRTVPIPQLFSLALRLSSKTRPSSLYRMNGIVLLEQA